MLLLVLSSAALCSAQQWATQPLQNTLSWNSISSGYANGLNGVQMGYPLLGNRLAAGSFGYGTGTIGATQLGAFGTTNNFGFAPTNTFPLSAAGGLFGATATPAAASTLLMPSSYPMGSVMMPAIEPIQPPPNPATVGGNNPAEAKYYWNKEWAEQQEENTEAYNPTYRWEQYKSSFVVTQGVPSDYNNNVARSLLSMDKWWTAMIDTPSVRSFTVPFAGVSAPRYNTFPVPGSPSMPVVPCPIGTPEYVCAQASKNIGMRYPTPPDVSEDEEEQMEYAYYQNLIQRNYPGYGPVYPRTPINGQPFRQVGPNPGPFAPRPPLDCDFEIDYAWEVKQPGNEIYGRGTAFVAEIMYKCACTPTGMPIISQCTKAVLEEAEELYPSEGDDEVDPAVAADATIVGATGGAKLIYGVSYPTNIIVQSVTPCGNFASYNPDVPCLTLLSEGFTPEPPLRISGPQSAQPQSNGEGPWWTDPYACSVEIEAVLYFDSPFAWENNYDAEYSIENGNELDCLCDKFSNPILSSCRQSVSDPWPIMPTGPPPDSDSSDDSVRRREAFGSAREARQAGAPAARQEDEVDRAVREAMEAAEAAQKAAEYAVKLAKRAEFLAKKKKAFRSSKRGKPRAKHN